MILLRLSNRLFEVFAAFCAAVVLANPAFAAAAPQIRTVGGDPVLPRQIVPGTAFSVTSLGLGGQPGPAGTYQWYFNDQPLVGETGATLTFANATTAHTGNYSLVVTSSGVATRSNIETINVVAPPRSAIDTTFTFVPKTGETRPWPVLVTSDGGLIVSTYSQLTETSGYERLKLDGSHDASFAYAESAGQPVAALPDGGVLTRKAPYRLDALGAPNPITIPPSFDPALEIATAAAQADGKFYLAQGRSLIRFNPDGTIDPTFTDTSGSAQSITAITLDLDGRLLVKRTSYLLDGEMHYPFDRLSQTGAKDSSFTPPARLPFPEFPAPGLSAIWPQAAGGYYATYSGMAIVRLDADGSVDETWGLITLTTFPPRAGFFQVVADAGGRIFVRAYAFEPHRYFNSAEQDPTFYVGQTLTASGERASLTSMLLAPTGHLYIGGDFTVWDGHATQWIARLRTTDSVIPAPTSSASQSTPFRRGTDLILSASNAAWQGPLTFQWLALDGQPLPANTTSAELNLGDAAIQKLGRYQARVTGPAGTTLTNVVTVAIPENAIHLANISGRAKAGEGENTVIAGFITPKEGVALLRGVGPSLQSAGLSNIIAQPALDIFDSTGARISSIGAWQNSPSVTEYGAKVGAVPLDPGKADAAAPISHVSGAFTVHLLDTTGTGGVGLCEIYPTTAASAPTNLSFRARTEPGEGTAIAGFVIADSTNFGGTARVLLRAVSSSLPAAGIQQPLEDPVLRLYNGSGAVIAANDNWSSGTTAETDALKAAIAQVGASPLPADSKDAVLLLDLPAGVYSLHATGGTGIVVMEIFHLR